MSETSADASDDSSSIREAQPVSRKRAHRAVITTTVLNDVPIARLPSAFRRAPHITTTVTGLGHAAALPPRRPHANIITTVNASQQLPPVPRQTAPRPGQLPPVRRRHAASRSALDDDEGAGIDDSTQHTSTSYADGPSHGEKARRKDENWRRIIPGCKAEYTQTARQRQSDRQRAKAAQLLELQTRINDAWQYHRCCHGADGVCSSEMLTSSRDRSSIEYRSVSSSGLLLVPTYRCSLCNAVFQPTAIQVGCFRSTPVVDTVWYDEVLCELYSALGLPDGVSVTAFCAAIDHTNQLAAGSDTTGSDTAGSDSSYTSLRPSSFEGAWFAHVRVTAGFDDLAALGVTGMDASPMSGCMICANVPVDDALLDDDERAYRVSLAADAVTKVGHHAACAQSTRDIKPHLRAYFSDAADEVERLQATGELNLTAFMASAGASAAPDDADLEAPSCSASLSCSRAEATVAGACDIHGIVGAVCAHTVPIFGAFMDMPTPEQFVYYLIMLSTLSKQLPLLRDVYIDFGCQLAKTWTRYLNLSQLDVGVRIMVNWMHVQSHNEKCRATNSGLHKVGAARTIGENSEQLWSMLKWIGGLVRYMTLANRRDFLESALRLVQAKKMSGMTDLLQYRYAAALKHQDSTALQLADVVLDATAHGVNVEAAREVYKAHVTASTSGSTSWQVNYVRALELLAAKQAATQDSKRYVVMDSTLASTMAKAAVPRELKKAQDAVAALERANGVLARWTSDHAVYKEAFEELRKTETRRLQSSVEVLVLEVHQLHEKLKKMGTTDKQNKAISSRQGRLRQQAHSQLGEMYTWLCRSTSQTVQDVQYTQEQVKEMFQDDGRFPWEPEAASATTRYALQVMHGRKFHTAASYFDRTKEEVVKIRVEKKRLLQWLKHAEAQVIAALAIAPVDGSRQAFRMDSLETGKSHLLQQWLERLKRMHSRALLVLAAIPA